MLKKAAFPRVLLPLLFAAFASPAAAETSALEQIGIQLLPARSFVLALPLPQLADLAEERGSATGHYLDPRELDLRSVAAAPADGSAQDKEDFRVILDWQARRTPAQCAAAKSEMNHDYNTFFGRLSPFPAPLPETVKTFFKNVQKDSVAAHKFLKDVYKRGRPFVRDARVQPCLPRVQGFAYPSGHSAMARLEALILADLVPARRNDFMAKADESALLRVLGGVHHPTDTAAGKALADLLYKELKKNAAFASDLKAIKNLLK